MHENFLRLKEKILPSSSIIGVYFDKFLYFLNILRFRGLSEFLWESRIFLLLRINSNYFDSKMCSKIKMCLRIKKASSMNFLSLLNLRYHKKLTNIDQKIKQASPEEIVQLFEEIPLDIFGILSLTKPAEFPNIANFFPDMPAEELQKQWVGESGFNLLIQTINFISLLISYYNKYCKTPIRNAKVLDYGCGWGRMLRILYKYIPTTNLYGVDPNKDIIETCKKNKLGGNIGICDYIPKDLPFEDVQFDLIFAYSIFTHLSEKCHKAVLKVLYERLKKNGIMIITIRPRFFWDIAPYFDEEMRQKAKEIHDRYGYAFLAHDYEPINGEVTYGDTSITFKYIQDNWKDWKLIRKEFVLIDPYQLICVLKKR